MWILHPEKHHQAPPYAPFYSADLGYCFEKCKSDANDVTYSVQRSDGQSCSCNAGNSSSLQLTSSTSYMYYENYCRSKLLFISVVIHVLFLR